MFNYGKHDKSIFYSRHLFRSLALSFNNLQSSYLKFGHMLLINAIHCCASNIFMIVSSMFHHNNAKEKTYTFHPVKNESAFLSQSCYPLAVVRRLLFCSYTAKYTDFLIYAYDANERLSSPAAFSSCIPGQDTAHLSFHHLDAPATSHATIEF